ncbi:tetratricopeptide repeat protein [Rhodanobacter sp. Si-c]|uniref:Tetratricopeptide repeat protein n=1 Tax=Rhodanobacter lycopersici TaxID=3162487 RepID=A0ABV3QBE9_9GAMM
MQASLSASWIWPALALLAILTLTWWVYHPGLSGGFLFDDFANLPAIGASGPVTHWATFWRYITSGMADPTGRPLTLLTFLIDARNWPASPYPFKLTNVILHLCNGLLLYALLVRLGMLLDVDARRARIAAWFGCGAWLLHPLLLSTTLYIVQREAMLPATCVLAGLLLWLHGRACLRDGHLKSGPAWMIAGLGGFTLLGTLAKANGALLPMYALLIELLVLMPRHVMQSLASQRTNRVIVALFCAVPAFAILGYLAWKGVLGSIHGGHAGARPWSIGQRLLTEPRVLVDYLKLLWIPRPFTSGLFNDQFAVSTSWLHPASTLPCLLAVLALIGGAWWQRRRHPALALALLFYFAGQSLESSSIPLELYFEHRNYIPALLMFWPLGLWLADLRTLRLAKIMLLAVIPLLLAGMTHARAQVWGNVRTQALIWAHINPDSPRAQANAAEVEMGHGHPQAAAARLQKLLATEPSQTQLTFNLIGARCMAGEGLRPGDMEIALTSMRSTADVGALIAHWYERMLPVASEGRCPGLTPETLLTLIDAGLQNPNLKSAGMQQDLIYLKGLTALTMHQPDLALSDFMRALDQHVRPGMALEAAATLGSYGHPSLGLRMLDHYEQVQGNAMPPSFGMAMVHEWVLSRQRYWPHELAHLKQELTEATMSNHANATPRTSTPSPCASHCTN